MKRELDLCIFDCTIKAKRLCVYVRCCYRGQALSGTAIFYTSLLTFKVVSSDCFVFCFFLYIYKYMKAFLNILTLFFIHPVQYAV